MGYILAVHAGHNAAACIGDERGILYAVQEERLNGEKNFWGYPSRAIEACLAKSGAERRDIDVVVNGGKQVGMRYHSREDVLEAYRRQESLVGKLRQRVAMPLVLALKSDWGQDELARALSSSGLGHAPVVHTDHHFTHAATAYFGLRRDPAEPYLVVTTDGDGDGACASVHVFRDGRAEELARTDWDSSLGAIYSWITYNMGFVPLEHEYKLMGMAPYASDKAAAEVAQLFRNYLDLREDGLGFQKKTFRRTNDLGATLQEELAGVRFDHVCAGLQLFTEELLVGFVRAAVRKSGVRSVLAAGGVFMNVKANKRIAELAEVDSFEAFPSCGDETLPFGAFWLESAKRFGAARVKALPHYYLGDDLDEAGAARALSGSGLRYEKPADLPGELAALLVEGHPVARCAGPMEYGARALGNRSILADPKNGDVVRVINRMVKKRDFWMPFAPMVIDRRQDDYLVNPKKLPSPYMMMTFDTRENYAEIIAAVHNADLTCRAQILSQAQNPEMFAILEAFERRTGRGVVLNTSYNLHGFPISRTGEDALHVFTNSGLQHMQLGPFLVHKV